MLSSTIFGCLIGTLKAQDTTQSSYHQKAAEVTAFIQKNFWLENQSLYSKTIEDRSPDFIWGGGVMFSTVVSAARNDSRYHDIMRKYYVGLESYWDAEAAIPGYEPSPIGGNGNDKYYDDNAWLAISFIEAYEISGDSRYLKRAEATLDFVMSGWDDVLGGGIWWHEKHKEDSKNTCANAPTAVACFRLSKYLKGENRKKRIADGMKITNWTTRTLRGKNGLFGDNIKRNGVINHGQLTYNSALMLRAFLCIHTLTGEEIYLNEARKIGRAAEVFVDSKTGAYRDLLRWSHLMVEADLELYR
ncbi:MAG: glycoside hydrolase family 76 protein, partial [Luteolibacter sp.]